MVEAVWLGQEREGSHGWGAGLRGSGRAGQGTWHRGQDPQGRAADLPGVLRSRVRGGHSLQTKRGRSSAERGGTGWPGGLGGQDGWPGQAGGLGVSSLVGTAPRARCWGGREAPGSHRKTKTREKGKLAFFIVPKPFHSCVPNPLAETCPPPKGSMGWQNEVPGV